MPRRSSKLDRVPDILREEAAVINGRLHYFSHLRNIRQVEKGRYEGTRNGHQFTIEGGRKFGGTRRDWFVDMPAYFDRSIHCTSVIDALTMLDNM